MLSATTRERGVGECGVCVCVWGGGQRQVQQLTIFNVESATVGISPRTTPCSALEKHSKTSWCDQLKKTHPDGLRKRSEKVIILKRKIDFSF
jgi:hypothetical protein